MIIFLQRHGRPAEVSRVPIYAAYFSCWIEKYNRAQLAESSRPSKNNKFVAANSNKVFCSTLPRSVQSAGLLCGVDGFEKKATLVEAGMPCADWRVVKFPPGIWAVVFRIFWFFGFSRNCESYKQARLRARVAAGMLITAARENGTVLFVGHGIFNLLIARELRARGWEGPVTPASKYWEYSIYRGPIQ